MIRAKKAANSPGGTILHNHGGAVDQGRSPFNTQHVSLCVRGEDGSAERRARSLLLTVSVGWIFDRSWNQRGEAQSSQTDT